MPGVGDDGADWCHRPGAGDHPELVARLERWAADVWLTRLRLVEPAIAGGGTVLRGEGHGQPEEFPALRRGARVGERSRPRWLQANELMSASR